LVKAATDLSGDVYRAGPWYKNEPLAAFARSHPRSPSGLSARVAPRTSCSTWPRWKPARRGDWESRSCVHAADRQGMQPRSAHIRGRLPGWHNRCWAERRAL